MSGISGTGDTGASQQAASRPDQSVNAPQLPARSSRNSTPRQNHREQADTRVPTSLTPSNARIFGEATDLQRETQRKVPSTKTILHSLQTNGLNQTLGNLVSDLPVGMKTIDLLTLKSGSPIRIRDRQVDDLTLQQMTAPRSGNPFSSTPGGQPISTLARMQEAAYLANMARYSEKYDIELCVVDHLSEDMNRIANSIIGRLNPQKPLGVIMHSQAWPRFGGHTVGMILQPRSDSTDPKQLVCILNDSIDMLSTRTRELLHALGIKDAELAKIDDEPPSKERIRQKDEVGCGCDALVFLKDGMQHCDTLKELADQTEDSLIFLTRFKDGKSGDLSIDVTLRNFKTTQRPEYLTTFSYNPDDRYSHAKPSKTIGDHRQAHELDMKQTVIFKARQEDIGQSGFQQKWQAASQSIAQEIGRTKVNESQHEIFTTNWTVENQFLRTKTLQLIGHAAQAFRHASENGQEPTELINDWRQKFVVRE